MRYIEVLEHAERLRAERLSRARAQIATADKKRADAARKYRDDLGRAHSSSEKAKADLRRISASANECAVHAPTAAHDLYERRFQQLRDRNGVPLGWLEPVGRLLQARDHRGVVVGWYDARTDQTRDRKGSLVGTGDLLTALLFSLR